MDKKHIVKSFGEPVFPYAANTYNTLSSTVQNVALAAIAYFFVQSYLDQNFYITLNIVARGFVSMLFVVMIWHRYITHNHFAAWMPHWADTGIICIFAILQYFIIFTTFSDVISFSIAVTITSSWGIISYKNTRNSFLQPITKQLFLSHFNNKIFVTSMLAFFDKFHETCIQQVSRITAGFILVSFIIVFFPNYTQDEWQLGPLKFFTVDGGTVLISMNAAIASYILFKYDIGYYLKNDADVGVYFRENDLPEKQQVEK